MKKSLIMLALASLLSLSAFAADDVAKGSCLLKISKNKTKSKYKSLRNSELEFNDIMIKPLNRFLAEGKMSKIYIDFENVKNEAKNRILIFSKDKDRLETLGDVNYHVSDFDRAIYFTVEYIGKNMKAGSFSGPGVRVSTMTQRGKVGENFFGLEKDKETEFEAKVPARTIYRVFSEVDGEQKHSATKKHTSKMKLSCSFKTVDIAHIEVQQESEIEITSGVTTE